MEGKVPCSPWNDVPCWVFIIIAVYEILYNICKLTKSPLEKQDCDDDDDTVYVALQCCMHSLSRSQSAAESKCSKSYSEMEVFLVIQ